MAKETQKQPEPLATGEALPVEAPPVSELKTPDTAPLEKPLGMMTWEEECAYYAKRRKIILGETDAN